VTTTQVTPNAVSYYFISPSLGWAVLSGAGQSQVFRTTDGAKHWEKQLVGESATLGFSSLTVQLFGNNGYLAFGRPLLVFRTNDAGAHWNSVQPPVGPVESVVFKDANHGWLLSTSSGVDRNLFVTGDGAKTWQPLPGPPAGSGPRLSARGSAELWLGSFSIGLPRVYASSDGGLTWHLHNLPLPPSAAGEQWPWQALISLLPGVGVVASVSCECAQNSTFTFTSFDAGNAWRFIQAAPGFVAYQDDSHWWAVNSGTLYRSADAGQIWIKTSDRLPDWQFLPHAIDARHAWALLFVPGGSGLALSNDSGQHWRRAEVPHYVSATPS
jgi:photosystem II stability/assembly factor-like uncharacterized protein